MTGFLSATRFGSRTVLCQNQWLKLTVGGLSRNFIRDLAPADSVWGSRTRATAILLYDTTSLPPSLWTSVVVIQVQLEDSEIDRNRVVHHVLQQSEGILPRLDG